MFYSISMPDSKFYNDIPIIDILPLLERYKENSASKEIGNACRDIGFFYVINHGIPIDHQITVLRDSSDFFKSSLEQKNLISTKNHSFYSGYVPFHGEKTKGKLDNHEAFDMIKESPLNHLGIVARHPARGPNQWPYWMKTFKGTMLKNWSLMEQLGNNITKGIFLSLGLEEQLMKDYMSDPISMQRILHYPKSFKEEQGIGAHRDYGFVTMVMQDREGLEVKTRDDSWIKVKQMPNSFIVNIGWMVQTWTNDLYPATEHRVLIQENDRISVVFFIGPSPYINVSPLESCCSQENPPKYKSYNYGDYVKRKMKESYVND